MPKNESYLCTQFQAAFADHFIASLLNIHTWVILQTLKQVFLKPEKAN